MLYLDISAYTNARHEAALMGGSGLVAATERYLSPPD